MDDLITLVVSLGFIVGVVVVIRAITSKPKPKQNRWFEVGSSDVMNAHRKAKKEKEKS